MRIAANLTLLFPELPLLARIERAKALGFDGVEILFPYEIPVEDLARALDRSGLPLALINTPTPGRADGFMGCAAIPGQEALFRAQFAEALHYARTCGAERIHVMSGVSDSAQAFDVLVANLRWAVAEGAELTIEPLNPVDAPGYVLSDFAMAVQVIEAVGAAGLGLQFDLWHAQRLGDVAALWARFAPWVRHVQFARMGARGAPDGAEAALVAGLRGVLARGYEGWISAEYRGVAGDAASWLAPLRAALKAGVR